MKTIRDHCVQCNKILGNRIFNLEAKQVGFTIKYVLIPCDCGHENLVCVR